MYKSGRKYRTNYLWGKTGFVVGIGGVFGIYGNYCMFNYSDTGVIADTKALENDWGVIGQDIHDAIDKHKL